MSVKSFITLDTVLERKECAVIVQLKIIKYQYFFLGFCLLPSRVLAYIQIGTFVLVSIL